jgi:hypothetical protein
MAESKITSFASNLSNPTSLAAGNVLGLDEELHDWRSNNPALVMSATAGVFPNPTLNGYTGKAGETFRWVICLIRIESNETIFSDDRPGSRSLHAEPL